MLGREDGQDRPEPVVYCVIPADLAATLHELLREHFRDQPGVRVVVERRAAERRSPADRRREESSSNVGSPAHERRRINSATGRRLHERRPPARAVDALPLPRKARRFADRLVFVERIAADDQDAEDADSDRLVMAHQCGEESAFGELYLRYFDSVHVYARVALRDRHSAEDVAQQVFVNVLAVLSRYEIRADRPFRAWLFRIAHNEVVDVVKHKQRVTGQDPAELARRRDADAAADASAVVESCSALEWLSDHELELLVGQLPLAQRQLLTLRYLLDLSHEQIATILDKDPKALRKMSSRALRTLEARLTGIGRTSGRRMVRDGMLVRLKPLPVLKARRFALGPPTRRRVA